MNNWSDFENEKLFLLWQNQHICFINSGGINSKYAVGFYKDAIRSNTDKIAFHKGYLVSEKAFQYLLMDAENRAGNTAKHHIDEVAEIYNRIANKSEFFKEDYNDIFADCEMIYLSHLEHTAELHKITKKMTCKERLTYIEKEFGHLERIGSGRNKPTKEDKQRICKTFSKVK